MGEVLLIYRILPDGTEVDLDELQEAVKAALPAAAEAKRFTVKPFAFGLNALEATIIVEDEEGNNDKVEEALSGIQSVQGVELLDMGRVVG